MNKERLSHRRPIVERIIIQGTLTLETPACLGSGETDSPTDLPLLRDSISLRALLTGASVAGALRQYLWEYRCGYNQPQTTLCETEPLFGTLRSNDADDGDQSPLIVNDALSEKDPPHIELRDGVKIADETGVAVDGAKYDLELLAAGTTFPIGFELLIEKGHDRSRLVTDLAIALKGLETGEIALGMKKRRGFGQCTVSHWKIWQFDLTQAQDRFGWLTWPTAPNIPNFTSLLDLAPQLESVPDKRTYFDLKVACKLRGALLIRSAPGPQELAPDVVQLMSWRGDSRVPVLSGTSLAGVLRHRAARILNTLALPSQEKIDALFGPDLHEGLNNTPQASRLLVHESEVKNAPMMVQNRIAIDRFTGGALDGALFNEQPIFGSEQNTVTIHLRLRQPLKEEIGLFLLLLKDLWTGDLPVGGSSSIGRGRLKGIRANLIRQQPSQSQSWQIEQQVDGQLEISDAEALEEYVAALFPKVEEERAAA